MYELLNGTGKDIAKKEIVNRPVPVCMLSVSLKGISSFWFLTGGIFVSTSFTRAVSGSTVGARLS